ncbi:MAG: hypothetical protein M3371_03930, partial [Acidobacteriota bacterium]|nr:hypothetical protein [Acidobacteriota bacterium]
MKRPPKTKKKIEIKIGEGDNDALINFAETPEGKELGLHKFESAYAKGVTFGRPLHPFEREGSGLPAPSGGLPHQEFHFEFDVRFTLNES